MIPANYQVLVDLSLSENVTPSVRAYLVELLGEHREMRKALQAITDHFAAVMGGPVLRAAGIVFRAGPEGIPTIATARAILAKVQP